MNSDPYDSAAWRTFGMLDVDESAIFDEARQLDPVLQGAYLDIERICAAIAIATVEPIYPRPGQLERLQSRLGLTPSRYFRKWVALSGWAAAALLAAVIILDRSGIIHRLAELFHVSSIPITPVKTPPSTVKKVKVSAAPGADSDRNGIGKTKRLIQEIEVLRANLEDLQHSDRALFEAVPGVALPMVMTMTPPGVSLEDTHTPIRALSNKPSPLTALLGEALRMLATPTADQIDNENAAGVSERAEALAKLPIAIPIYDAARDAGTLIINNLQPAENGYVYNLWVTVTGRKPVFVGVMPLDSTEGPNSFDFSLGSNTVLPSGYLLTKDRENFTTAPAESNTVLVGPSTSHD